MKTRLVSNSPLPKNAPTYPALFRYNVSDAYEKGFIIYVKEKMGEGICIYSDNKDEFMRKWNGRDWDVPTFERITTPITIEFTP